MSQIDYRKNAVHALRVLALHGQLDGHEKVITDYLIKVLEKTVGVIKVTESYSVGDYGMHQHDLEVEGTGLLR